MVTIIIKNAPGRQSAQLKEGPLEEAPGKRLPRGSETPIDPCPPLGEPFFPRLALTLGRTHVDALVLGL